MADNYLGQMLLVPYNFAPQGFAFCNGQTLAISQNTALFSLLGVNFGGNGTTNFALPNLQGTIAIGMGQGTGLSSYSIGQTGGTENVTLTVSNLPAHSHSHTGSTAQATTNSPSAASFGSALPRQPGEYGAAPTVGNKVALNATAVSPAGGSQPHSNTQPTLVLNWVIALQGVYPSRQ